MKRLIPLVASLLVAATLKGAVPEAFYWFDRDDAQMTQSTIEGIRQIDASALSDGFHFLNCLVSDTAGHMSSVHNACFFKTAVPEQGVVDFYVDDRLTESRQAQEGTFTVLVNPDATLRNGLHILRAAYRSKSGTLSSFKEAVFFRVPTDREMGEMKGNFIIDKGTVLAAQGSYTSGLLHADIDMSEIPEGLHTLDFMLSSPGGLTTLASTALFFKTRNGGNGITSYAYWVNDDTERQNTYSYPTPVDTCSVTSLLPLPNYPLRSSSFRLEMDAEGNPRIYALNDLKFIFTPVSGQGMLKSTPYVDVNTWQEVRPVKTLSSGVPENVGTIKENEIRWYRVTTEYGDSLTFSLSQPAVIEVYSDKGRQLMKADGVASTKTHGFHTLFDGECLVAVHDPVRTSPVTIRYTHIDRYCLLGNTPTSTATTGILNVELSGNGFGDLKDVSILADGTEYPCDTVIAYSDGMALAQFDLYSYPELKPGNADLRLEFDVSDQADRYFTRHNALTLEKPVRGPIHTKLDYNVFKDGVSPHKIRVIVTNKSNVGSAMIPLNLALVGSHIEKVEFDNFALFNMAPIDADSIPVSANVDNIVGLGKPGDFIPLNLPYLGPRESIQLELSLWMTANSWGKKWEFYAWPGKPVSWRLGDDFPASAPRTSGISLDPAENDSDNDDYCGEDSNIEDIYDIINNCPLGRIPHQRLTRHILRNAIGVGEALAGITQGMSRRVNNELVRNGTVPMGHDISEYAFRYRYRVRSPYDIVHDVYAPLLPNGARQALGLWRDYMNRRANGDCPSPEGWSLNHIPLSWDPNDISGFTNASGSEYIGLEDKTLEYTVEFENDSTMATIGASKVKVDLTLDPKLYDLASLRPQYVKFGSHLVNVESDEPWFYHTEELRPSINALAEVSHTLDPVTGHSEWVLQALHPTTLQPLRGEMYGVLPVNNSNGDGQGQLCFSVRLRDGLPDGTDIDAKATIIFDSNEPINTPVWHNQTDYVHPESQITDGERYSDNQLRLKWVGNDARAGIWKYSLYCRVGDDNNEWKEIESGLTGTDTIVNVQPSTRYAFMVRATDRAGNVERKEPQAELIYNDGNISLGLETVGSDSLTDDDVLYDLQGRRVYRRPEPGIYIRAGRKILITR